MGKSLVSPEFPTGKLKISTEFPTRSKNFTCGKFDVSPKFTFRRGALGFHGLRVWPILAVGFRDFPEKRAGFRVLDAARVTGFAIFLARVSGIVIKMCGFSGSGRHTGSQFSKGQ